MAPAPPPSRRQLAYHCAGRFEGEIFYDFNGCSSPQPKLFPLVQSASSRQVPLVPVTFAPLGSRINSPYLASLGNDPGKPVG
jgi:hypothetical protein